MNKAMSPIETSRTRSPVLQNLQSYRRPGEMRPTPRVSTLATPPLYRSLHGKQLENQTHHHGNMSGLWKVLHFGNHWVRHRSLKIKSLQLHPPEAIRPFSQAISFAVS